jgi:succinate-acetate transporter protein
MFLISSFGIHARGIHTANLMISVLIFFGGICQYIVGAMEFITGNTFGFTVFTSYGAFNMSYSMIYLPGSGIMAAYTDKETGHLTSEFQQSVALYLWVWFILTVIFTMAALRSSWVLVLLFAFLDICLMLLAIGNMINNQRCLLAGYGIGYIVTLFSCKYLYVPGFL